MRVGSAAVLVVPPAHRSATLAPDRAFFHHPAFGPHPHIVHVKTMPTAMWAARFKERERQGPVLPSPPASDPKSLIILGTEGTSIGRGEVSLKPLRACHEMK